MRVRATRIARFSAAHTFHNPQLLDPEEALRRFGKAALPNGHGHNYILETTVIGPTCPQSGMILNLSDLKTILKNEVIEPLDFRFLNHDIDYFQTRLPTGENLLRYLWGRISERLPAAVELDRLLLHENHDLSIAMTKNRRELFRITRKYDFCASHRLDNPKLSPEENKALYGKCNHLHGHGHNYELDVTVRGIADPQIGTAVDLGVLDQVVEDAVVTRLDHRHLNLDVEEFQRTIPTSENLVRYIWEQLEPALRNREIELDRIRLAETPRNVFEYSASNA